MVEGWKIWPAFTFINMLFLPESLFMPMGYIIGYFWNTYLSLKGSTEAGSEDSSTEPKTPAQDGAKRVQM